MRVCENALLAWFIVGTTISIGHADPGGPGAVTVSKVAADADGLGFDFTSPQFGDFTLYAGLSQTFTGIGPGDYQIRELAKPGWQLYKVRADSSTSAGTDTLDWLTSTISFHLDAGEVLDLAFYNRALEPHQQSIPPAVPAPPAVLLVGLGAAVSATLRRRRII